MFYRLSLAAAFLFGALSLTLIFLPEIVYWLFQLEGNTLGDLLGKRAGMLFLGLAILCFYARTSISPEVRSLVALAVASSMGGMAMVGLYELVWGMAGPGILVAVAIELTLAALYSAQWVENR